MNDREAIESFGDMVKAAERLSRPWRTAFFLSNLLWAAAFLIRALL